MNYEPAWSGYELCGKKSQILADFGLAPWKTRGKKGRRAKKQ